MTRTLVRRIPFDEAMARIEAASGTVPAAAPAAARAAGPTTITSLPEIVHLELYQGDAFYLTLNVFDDITGAPFNLASATPKAQVRQDIADHADIMAEFTATVSGNVLSLTLPSAQAALLTPGRNVWDAQITIAGAVTTLCAGTCTVTGEVTR